MLTIFILLIILSAFFSSLETALFNLKSNQDINKNVKDLLSHPKRLLSTLLTGNTIVNIALGSLAATYALNLYNNNDLFSNFSLSGFLILEVIVVTIIILIFGNLCFDAK